VVVVPSATPSQPKPPSSNGSTSKKRPLGTIEIIVRLSSVVIKVHGRYNVYPKHVQEDCEPLIQLHTTTSETISLQTVRIRDTDGASLEDLSNEDTKEASTLILQERITDTTGKRILSVQPARYKKVEVWSSATPTY